jgi:hypothetical protein
MSRRDDTPYWQDLNKKSILKYISGNYDINRVITTRDYYHYNSTTGLHCVATGMERFPTDEISLITENYLPDVNKFLIERFKKNIIIREKLIKEWDKAAKNKIKYIDYLNNIHNAK